MKISIRHRRTYSLAVFCALTSVFLILYGCGGGGDGGGGGPVAVTYGISGQATLTGSGLSGVTMALSGVNSSNAITDASGNYAFTGLDNGSYTITPSKTGFTFSPTSSQKTVSGANITGVNFIATATPLAAFSQADVAGQWDALFFSTGVTSGWGHGTVVIDSTGKWAPMTNFANSGGGIESAPGSATWTMDNTGIISASDNGVANTFAGHMSSDKKLIVGVVGFNNGASDRLTVLRKRTDTVFSSADLASKTFSFHSLASGTDNTWSYGSGTIDGSGLTTITSEVTPSGTLPGRSQGTRSVSSSGIVTLSLDNTFYGVMTDDKKVIFSIDSNSSNSYSFSVITITGQTYTQVDLAGVRYFNTINSATTNPGWAWGSTSIDATGAGTYLTYKDAGNGATPGPFTRVLSATGVETDPASPTFHGQLSYNKDLSVRTATNASGKSQIAIGIK